MYFHTLSPFHWYFQLPYQFLVSEQVERPAQLHVRYQDLDGETHIEAANGFRAACHQHELDQLNGTFWIQKLSNLRRNRLIARYEKLQRNRN